MVGPSFFYWWLSDGRVFFRRKRLLKSSSWPSTSYLGHLPLFVVPQRMLLKLREDNSNFLAVLCGDYILSSYVLYLLLTRILRVAIVRKRDRYTFNLHVNAFIMPIVLQIYFPKTTVNHSTLSKIIHLIIRFILLIKLTLSIFGSIPGIFARFEYKL